MPILSIPRIVPVLYWLFEGPKLLCWVTLPIVAAKLVGPYIRAWVHTDKTETGW